MTELKTLKDFPLDFEEDYHWKEELKQEAIKWVKYMNENYDIEKNIFVKYWKDFFNITEEDLK